MQWRVGAAALPTGRSRRSYILVAALALVPACRRPPATSDALAQVGDRAFTAADLQHRVDELSPLIKARYGTVERRRELLETMVRNELLAQEARRRRLEESPAVREQVDRALVQELLRVELEAQAQVHVAEGEIRKHYDAHLEENLRPERARTAHLLLVPATARDKAKARVGAERLRREIEDRQRRGEAGAFATVAQQRSGDRATRSSGGELGFLTKEVLAARLVSTSAADAAFALRAGELAGPFETPNGFELIKLEMKSPGVSRSFDEARETIRAQLARERQGRIYEELIQGLRKRGRVLVDEAALARTSLDVGAPPATSAQLRIH